MIKDITIYLAKRRISNFNRFSPGELKMPIATVAVLLGSINIMALPVLVRLKKELNLKDSDFKLVLYKEKEDNFPEFDGLTFVEEDLNFFGNFNNKELLCFTKNHTDLLITFAEEDNVLLNLLTATCKAGLKIGNNPDYEKIQDVVIKSGNEVEVFASELIKILKQFKNN